MKLNFMEGAIGSVVLAAGCFIIGACGSSILFICIGLGLLVIATILLVLHIRLRV